MEPATWASNEHLDPVHLNSRIRDANTSLSRPPYGILANAPNYTFTSDGTPQEMRFSDAWSSRMATLTSGAIKRGFKVAEDGLYDIDLCISAQIDGGSPDSHLNAFVAVNGALAARGIFTARHGYTQSAYVKRMFFLRAGDEVTARVFTDTGRVAKFGFSAATLQGCRMTIRRIGANPAFRWA
ncbi:hypothetical protein [Streptomyces sp. NPDC058861]|uniref:hypothetical protein n=1 Tax=Streptomyces sp. NPDC058861 TaxID=3346653 RepID=UPI0036AA67C0